MEHEKESLCHCWFEDRGDKVMRNAGDLLEPRGSQLTSAGKEGPQSYNRRELSSSTNLMRVEVASYSDNIHAGQPLDLGLLRTQPLDF